MNRYCINAHCNQDWDKSKTSSPNPNCQCGCKDYNQCEYYVGNLSDMITEITEEQIQTKHRIKVLTCESIIYKLKSGKYFVDLGIHNKDLRLPNWGSKLNNVKQIPPELAEKLIAEFQKIREEYGHPYPDPI